MSSFRPAGSASARVAPFLMALASLLLSSFLSAGAGSAQTLRSFSFSADNDGLVYWVPIPDRSDRYYTSGLRMEGQLAWAPPWAGLLNSDEPILCGQQQVDEPCFLTRVAIGQKIFTPDYLFDPDPATYDRPYAGWLYLEAATEKLSPDGSTSLGLQVGVTGTPSMAGRLHRWFHRTLDKAEPVGWKYQIPFEPAFLVRYETRRSFPIGPQDGSASVRIEPRGSATLGTLRTGASVGLFMEAGWNSPSLRREREGGAESPFLLFSVGVVGEGVLRDLFLDGKSWGASPRTHREPWVGRIRGDLQFGWGRYGVEIGGTRSSLEFRGQDGGQSYGTLGMIIYH